MADTIKNKRVLYLDRRPGLWRAVRLVGGSLDAIWVEHDSAPAIVDRFFRARVVEHVLSANGAIVDLGDAGQAFLPALHAPGSARQRRDIRTAITLGAGLIVQGSADAGGRDKLPRVSARPALHLSGTCFRPGVDDGENSPQSNLLQARWQALTEAAAHQAAPAEVGALPPVVRLVLWASRLKPLDRIIVNDPAQVPVLTAALAPLMTVCPAVEADSRRWGLLDHQDIWPQVTQLLPPKHFLTGGGALTIERTQAFAAIDVDGGASRGATAALNETALRRLAALVRLRREAGLLVIDPAGDLPHKHLTALVEKARPWFDDAELTCQIAGPTRFGLIELRRQRRFRSLSVPFREVETAASAALGDWLGAVADQGRAPALEAGSDLIDCFKTAAGQAMIAEAADWAGEAPPLRPQPVLAKDQWRLV